jgi:hypothetical protein
MNDHSARGGCWVCTFQGPWARGWSAAAAVIVTIVSSGCVKKGTLANPGVDGQRIKTILFFAGEQLNGKTLPENNCPALPGNITYGCQTAWPLNQDLLDWTNPANRLKAVQEVAGLGFNTISMSSWGESWLPCTVECPYIPPACCKAQPDGACPHEPIPRCYVGANGQQQCRIGWYGSANTQLSPAAQDQLFDAVAQTSLQVIPFIESRFRYEWNFRTDFPTSQDPRFQGALAPGLISQTEDLIDRYLINPRNARWKDHWALVYDKEGEKRRAVAIVQAASDSLAPSDDSRFAEAFDAVADQIYKDTCLKNSCIKVGFFIDPIPRDPAGTYGCPGITGPVKSIYAAKFKPDPDATGPFLRDRSSILGIHAYSPEGWVDGSGSPVDECFKRGWKREFSRKWQSTGIPFLQDVTPGYDGTKLFGALPGLHRWGYNDEWRSALLDMTRLYGRAGLVYNSWNGYCEGLAAMDTIQQGTSNQHFIKALMATY